MKITKDVVTDKIHNLPEDEGKSYYGKPVILDKYEEGDIKYYIDKFYDTGKYTVAFTISFEGKLYGDYTTILAEPNEKDIETHIGVCRERALRTIKHLQNAKTWK